MNLFAEWAAVHDRLARSTLELLRAFLGYPGAPRASAERVAALRHEFKHHMAQRRWYRSRAM